MHRIAILTMNIVKGGGITSVNNLIKILNPISDELHLISTYDQGGENLFQDSNINTSFITHKGGGSKLSRTLNIIWTQIKMSYALLKLINHIETVYLVGDTLFLPALISKIFNKNIITALLSSSVQINEAVNDSFHREIKLVAELNYKLSDLIIIYSKSLINEWSLDKYKDKTHIIQEHFLDFDRFKITKKYEEREKIVGYLGRLSYEKGIMELIQAIPAIKDRIEDVSFLIGGTGPLEDEIVSELEQNNLTKQVQLTGWIPDSDFVDTLNQLKLLVIPSETEGLPYIILESMACGTPVLATNVGSIPDLINDGDNGFIMEDNSVESISMNISRVLEFSQLDKIAREAQSFVEKKFNYETAVKNYESMLDQFQ